MGINIKTNPSKELKTFDSLKAGDCFIYNNNFFMKVDEAVIISADDYDDDDEDDDDVKVIGSLAFHYNCVNLNKGIILEISRGVKVQSIEIEATYKVIV